MRNMKNMKKKGKKRKNMTEKKKRMEKKRRKREKKSMKKTWLSMIKNKYENKEIAMSRKTKLVQFLRVRNYKSKMRRKSIMKIKIKG